MPVPCAQAAAAAAAYVAVWCWGTERTRSAFSVERGHYANVCCHLLASVIAPRLASADVCGGDIGCSVAMGKVECVAQWIILFLACFSVRVGMNNFPLEGLLCNLDQKVLTSFHLNPPVISLISVKYN